MGSKTGDSSTLPLILCANHFLSDTITFAAMDIAF